MKNKKDIAEPGPKRRGRPKVMSDDAQRANIIGVARQAFMKTGYGGTTMGELAALCRISKRTLYRLFPNKIALFAGIVEDHRQSMLALPGAYDDLSLTDALETIFRIDIDENDDRDRQALLRLVMVETVQFPELAQLIRSHGADVSRRQLAEWLLQREEIGAMSTKEAEGAAKILMDMIFGAIIFKSREDDPWPNEDTRKEHLRRSVHIFVYGLSARR